MAEAETNNPHEAPVVAMVGGGQLARMSVAPAVALGVHLRVLVEASDGAAGQVVMDAPVGAAGDATALRDLVHREPPARVLTFEHEHVPGGALRELQRAGIAVRPSAEALLHAQDKIVMRRRLTELGVPCPRWVEATDPEVLAAFIAEVGGAVVVKTATGGYDGKGVRTVTDAGDVRDWFEAAADGGPALLAEERVDFTRELAVLVARRPSGQVLAWPVVQTVQEAGVCSEVIAPAPGLSPDLATQAELVALRVADGLGVTGVLAVELFETAAGVVVNELAMRPHNSGHWTIEGAVTSQFEQHLRAVLDLPLGETTPRQPWSVMVNVLGSALPALTDALGAVGEAYPGAKVHLYGKEIRPGRKLGHVTVCGTDLADVRARAREAAALLRGETLVPATGRVVPGSRVVIDLGPTGSARRGRVAADGAITQEEQA